MDIANLLAQGTRARPAGMEQNALMQGQEMQQRKLQMQNALMQMQDMHQQRQLQIAEAQRVAQQRASQDALLRGLQPVSGVQANAASGVVGPRPEAASAIGQRQKADPIALIRAGFSKEQIDQIMNADTMGLPEVARTIEQVGPNGPQTAQFDKYGRPVGSAIAKPVQMSMQDVGGRIVPVNPYTQTTPLTKTLSPSERDASARGWAGLKLQESEKNGPKWDPTNMVWTDPRTMKVVPGVGPDGKPLAGKPGNATEDERKSAGYAVRMEDALRTLSAVEKTNPAATNPGLGTSLTNMLPEGVANYLRPEDRQRVEAAQLDALDAALTLATGAAYTKEQLKGLSRAYFAQPADGEATKAEKAQRLKTVIETARVRAGRAEPSVNAILGRTGPNAPDAPRPTSSGVNPIFDQADAIIGIGNGKR